jgi:hypothetical protein
MPSRVSKSAKVFSESLVNSLLARRSGGGISQAMVDPESETIVISVRHIAADPAARADAAAQIERKMAEIGFSVTSKNAVHRKSQNVMDGDE